MLSESTFFKLCVSKQVTTNGKNYINLQGGFIKNIFNGKFEVEIKSISCCH